MEHNGKKVAANNLSVWKDESTSGLETIRKILLAQHVEDSEKKLAELSSKYEHLFQTMQLKMQRREVEFASKLQSMHEDFQLRYDELKSNLKQDISTVERKSKEHTTHKSHNLGEMLIKLGKEWTSEKDNG